MSLRRVSPEHALTVAQGRHQEDPGRLQPRPSMWNSYTYISPICMTLRYHTWMIWARSFQAEAIKCQMPNRPAHVCIAGALVVARTSACVKCKRRERPLDLARFGIPNTCLGKCPRKSLLRNPLRRSPCVLISQNVVGQRTLQDTMPVAGSQ